MPSKLIYLAFGLVYFLHNSKNENKTRNLYNAIKLGWSSKYNNKNPYPGLVKYDENKEYVGLNYDLIFDGKEYSKVRKKIFVSSFINKEILHQTYSSKVLNLKKGDLITGIQCKIATGFKGYIGEPSGNRIWSTPSNYKSNDLKISLGNLDDSSLVLKNDYYSNIKLVKNFTEVKKGLEWEDKDWPFGKVPLNDFGPIFKLDKEFIYNGENLFLEIEFPIINYIKTKFQMYLCVNQTFASNTYFDNKKVNNIDPPEPVILDIQFEVIRKK